MRPSVGTWFTPFLKRAEAMAPVSEKASSSTEKARAFGQSPSVGTWYMPR
eukprot:CAMPEP_0195075630 /NCGR_PEP_ID=MMETSP0448-20130528/18462_1 /TAXON_ID=66468 /ORGANISM="Heterocapsa triquestra, Strain CCMP 448" /LENGTH=49 /DNA_ID= /DNA_START= /DNA_END= /DNA_ORIENTATION=